VNAPVRSRPGRSGPMHPGQVHVGVDTVRALVAGQFPQWSTLPVEEVDTVGTVNAIFRVGHELAARFPLVAGDPAEVRAVLTAEREAARAFLRASPVPAPSPVALAEPGCGYPLPWSVQTWVPGQDATVEDPARSLAFAQDLAALITALRGVGTKGRRFQGPGRGGHLPDHDEWMEACCQKSEDLLDVARMRTTWKALRLTPEVDAPSMCHRDLTPPNVLVDAGRLVGILDTGAFGPADPAVDLVAAWHLLDEEPRELLRTTLGCSDVQWQRGAAWAFEQAMGLVWYYRESNPPMSRWGRRTLDRIVSSGLAWTAPALT
jgi:aminoglycoside phosphotransferase (APT) family kinase protein